MRSWTTFRAGFAAPILTTFVLIASSALWAQPTRLPSLPDRNNDAAAQPAAAPAAADAAAPAKKSDGSEFVIPEKATPDQLFEMANKLLNTEQSFETEAEYNDWIKKMIQTVYSIANKIMKMNNIDDETYKKAIALKGEMIYYHVWTNADAFSQYEKFIAEVRKDQRLLKTEGGQKVIDGQVVSFLHEKCVHAVQSGGSLDELKESVEEFRQIVMRDPEFVSMIPSFVYPVSQMAAEKKDSKILKDTFLKFATDMKKSDDKTLNDAANGLVGLLRFAELEGKPMKVVGTTASGEKFDPNSLKGKVFLLDFWASWVTPCIAQYPELLALYTQYHDKGFEIVGYNMDTEIDKFKDFVAQKNVPWENLSEQMSTENKQPSVAEFYGITTVPILILVGKDGNVIKNNVDIETLKKLLDEQFK